MRVNRLEDADYGVTSRNGKNRTLSLHWLIWTHQIEVYPNLVSGLNA